MFAVRFTKGVALFVSAILLSIAFFSTVSDVLAFQRRRGLIPRIFRGSGGHSIYDPDGDRRQKAPAPVKTKAAPKAKWHDETKSESKSTAKGDAAKKGSTRDAAALAAETAKDVEMARRKGYEDGYDSGFDSGDKNRLAKLESNFVNECGYHSAVLSYIPSFGPRPAYDEGYHIGFEQGYKAAWAGNAYANYKASDGTLKKRGAEDDATATVSDEAHGWRQIAEKFGYDDGLENGREAKTSYRVRPIASNHPEYERAIHGWTEGLCDRAAYQERYRRYFVLGYQMSIVEDKAEDGTKKSTGARSAKPKRAATSTYRGAGVRPRI